MSEYWKSTPKYWCKFCKAYVRDTKLERQQHEATGRHQGNIQRSLRNLHRDNEREEREKQRAKDEVARLNGLVSGQPASSSASAAKSRPDSVASFTKPPPGVSAAPPKVNLEERKAQMKQLADMGVAIPDQFRGDLALAGEWETVSVKKVETSPQQPEGPLSHGVRKKRKLTGDEEEEDDADEDDADNAGAARRKADWGSRYRSYPDSNRATASTNDIEALLSQGSSTRNDNKSDHVKANDDKSLDESLPTNDLLESTEVEPSTAAQKPKLEDLAEDAVAEPIVFKKRKSKAAKVK